MLALARSFAARAARAAAAAAVSLPPFRADAAVSLPPFRARLPAGGCSVAAAALVFWGCCFFLVDVREVDDDSGSGSDSTFSSALNLISFRMNRTSPVATLRHGSSSSTSKSTVTLQAASSTETTRPMQPQPSLLGSAATSLLTWTRSSFLNGAEAERSERSMKIGLGQQGAVC
tara:strand:+ start:1705 stop:2226 length:522 start_codon:yes stop_codon:yes gene_type:complete